MNTNFTANEILDIHIYLKEQEEFLQEINIDACRPVIRRLLNKVKYILDKQYRQGIKNYRKELVSRTANTLSDGKRTKLPVTMFKRDSGVNIAKVQDKSIVKLKDAVENKIIEVTDYLQELKHHVKIMSNKPTIMYNQDTSERLQTLRQLVDKYTIELQGLKDAQSKLNAYA